MHWFKSERAQWAARIDVTRSTSTPTLPGFDARSRELYGTALPRGVLLPRLEADRERINFWMSPPELMKHRFEMGQIILGKLGGTWLGHLDDRPMVTIAGARAGKTSTVLEPNLYLYPGSMLVLDPKGELARTAPFRRAMGRNVYVLDPFGQSGELSANFNPLAELDPDEPCLVDDIVSITNALVPDNGDARSKHWNDSARMLLVGLILLTLSLPQSERHLVTVRELLCLTYKPLALEVKAAVARALAESSPDEKQRYFDANALAIKTLLNRMAAMGDRFGGILAAIGNRFSQTPHTERGSIFSTAAAQTDFLDSLPLRHISKRSNFRLASLRSDRPTTIFLCLPVGRMERHSRWLRLIVQLACTAGDRHQEGLGRNDRRLKGLANDAAPVETDQSETSRGGIRQCLTRRQWPRCGVVVGRAAGTVNYLFPIRLGDQATRQDGVIGYYFGNDYTKLNSVAAPDTTTAQTYVAQIGPIGTAGGGNYIELPFKDGNAAYLTLLMDPRASAHAVTGIFPVKQLDIPARFVDGPLTNMEVSFRMGPILTLIQPATGQPQPGQNAQQPATQAITYPLPSEQNGTWSWLEVDAYAADPSQQWTRYGLLGATPNAQLKDISNTVREGFFQLTVNKINK